MAWWENRTKKVKWQQKSTQYNYSLNSRKSREVISPISLGMKPVRALPSNAFGDKCEKYRNESVRKQHI